MKYNISILSEAELDLDNAYVWYEFHQIGLGNKFYKSIEKSINFISQNPFSSNEVYKRVRRFIIRKFPFGIYYKVNINLLEIQIICVLHFKRDTQLITQRI
jgi:hypothetical protein